ncbi:hypothetical protein SK066_22745 [Paenibacillus hunanensis]|uniref:hypothetical protein n=1 Tax=Paenibacillus hunanensis TaxID=539262 RepID=UPI002A69E37E|nr:hypothetical protein [Paenibacillus hunanensis]WPP41337.1 hypothetical protein SK066_22745 [Paenibacillus hunanensis]
MDYKKVLLLVYLNTVKMSYSYNEMSKNFGLSNFQVEQILKQLNREKLIILHDYYQLSQKGKELLEDYGMENVDYYNAFDDRSILNAKKLSFEDIYIPIGFDKKMK